MAADVSLRLDSLEILSLGIVALGCSTVGGLSSGTLLDRVTGGEANPLIRSAGVSAVPIAARLSHDVGQEYNPHRDLLMHAMGPNVAGVVGTAIAAGFLLAILE